MALRIIMKNVDLQDCLPIHQAAREGDTDTLQSILSQKKSPKGNPRSPDSSGWTPLHHAVFGGSREAVRSLLGDERTNPNKSFSRVPSPLLLACLVGQEGAAEELLEHPALFPWQPSGPFHQTPFHAACEEGLDQTLPRLLRRAPSPELLEQRDTRGLTPLEIACLRGQHHVLSWLLPRLDPGKEKGLIRLAIHSGSEETLRLVLREGRWEQGSRLFWEACQSSPDRTIRILMADPRVDVDEEGLLPEELPLHLLARRPLPEILRELLGCTRLDPNRPSRKGRSPLHLAAEQGNCAGIQTLLQDPRVLPNIPDREGLTPLHLAVKQNQPKAICSLLEDPRVQVNRFVLFPFRELPPPPSLPSFAPFPSSILSFPSSPPPPSLSHPCFPLDPNVDTAEKGRGSGHPFSMGATAAQSLKG